MDDKTTHDTAPDASRFERLVDDRPVHEPSPREKAFSAVGLLALVIGLPVLLLVLGAPPPIPTSVPSLGDFARQLGVEDLITVLVAVVWLVWLLFIVCVVMEIIAARRGGLASRVPGAGPLQHLARILVGGLLVTGLVAGPAQAATAVDTAAQPTVAASVMAEQQLDLVEDVPEAPVASADDSLVGKKVYTVQAPVNGYHDNLWDIAERHLGDGFRYKEIYELNKDRLQPDGGRLELARLIQPGWDFIMPEDASGLERVAAPSATPATADVQGADQASATAADAADSSTAWWTGAGLLAAGVLGAVAVARRSGIGRRPDDDALDTEALLRVAASQARSALLEAALAQLARAAESQGSTLPSVYSVTVDDENVDLRLAPAMPEALPGWEAHEGGERWRYVAEDRRELEPGTSPYPALVSLGLDDLGRDVLIDLEAAGGIVSVGGDDALAAQVTNAIAVQAATSPWSGSMVVVGAGLPDGLQALDDERVTLTDDLASVVDEVAHVVGAEGEPLVGRTSRRPLGSSYLIASSYPLSEDVAATMGRLTGGERRAVSMVTVGDHPAARWRLSIDENGTLSAPQLGITVSAHRLSEREVAGVLELVSAARETDRGLGGDDDRLPVSEPPRRVDAAAWAAAQQRVMLLGSVEVAGADGPTDGRSELLAEILAYLALHPGGVHPTVLAGAVWPRGISADVRDANIERARRWLGTDAQDAPLLAEDADGRLLLGPEVVLDWDAFRTLVRDARRAANARDEIDGLKRALHIVRGVPLRHAGPGTYAWAHREGTVHEMTALIVDSAERLVELLGDDGDPDGAIAAAEVGLGLVPAHQGLWRDVIRQRHARDGAGGVAAAVARLREALGGEPLEAPTEELIAELNPRQHLDLA
ncbi:hypothetical protein [Aeromicrobium sp. PE09-221]|uniref:hypothetical protein n=1 Tax=Aeromicrobium sp. PE09-221 TaxID=1898043 RepID=UPI00111E3AA0|nr:hypothetical protein [Aeromicrobium sp. PE09-221]